MAFVVMMGFKVKMLNFFLKSKLYIKFLEKQILPTKEDFDNKEVKQLAERLKGESDSETLNNILEWQDINFQPWYERWFIYFILLPIILIGFAIGLYIVIFTNKTFLHLGIVILSISLGGMLFLIFYIILRFKNQLEILKDISRINLSTIKILKYKLANCGDYAKLTFSLLMNLYSKDKLYFITFRSHVAAVIEVNNKSYVLDQHMPIVDVQTWLKRWKKNKANLLKVRQNNGELKLEFVKTIKLDRRLDKITIILEKRINELSKAIKNNKNSFKYILKDYSYLYNINDLIIKDSLIRTIRAKLKDEFCSNYKKIKNVEIKEKEKDLILIITLNKEKD